MGGAGAEPGVAAAPPDPRPGQRAQQDGEEPGDRQGARAQPRAHEVGGVGAQAVGSCMSVEGAA